MKYWWVNHKQTHKIETEQGFLWSPQKNKNSSTNIFYDNMKNVSPGDIIFSYAKREISAVGRAISYATESPLPDTHKKTDSDWNPRGWKLEVEFVFLTPTIKIDRYRQQLQPLLPTKYSPLDKNFNGNQAYLFELPVTLADALLSLIDGLSPFDPIEEASQLSSSIPLDNYKTETIRMITARRGQPIFRKNVIQTEKKCRVTGVEDVNLLIASHIKPWSKSNEVERLDGNNGLLLAPHIDKLFDSGFISFSANGEILLSDELSKKIVQAWNVELSSKPEPFTDEQLLYLEYHKQNIFR